LHLVGYIADTRMESCISKERIQLHILGPLSPDTFDIMFRFIEIISLIILIEKYV